MDEAKKFIEKHRINGEVLVVDNASEDDSRGVAEKHCARVITELRRGYGSAIRAGISHSRGRVLIIGDCDTTYDFYHLEDIFNPLNEEKCDMVIGNRYAGKMQQGAMPWSHKWGVRFLSFCGRIRFKTDVYDFHCGLRGLSRKAAEKLELDTEGMEFATEMIAEAARQKLRINQVPVSLRKCEYPRKSKLRTIRDGLRHLRYIFKGKKKRKTLWEDKP